MKFNSTGFTEECPDTCESLDTILKTIRLPLEVHLLQEMDEFMSFINHSFAGQKGGETDISFSLEQHVLSVNLSELNHELSTRVHAIQNKLNMDKEDISIILMPENEYNAFALYNHFGGSLILGLNSRILDDFSLDKTLFVLGHEKGHHELGHTKQQRKFAIQSFAENHPLSRKTLTLSRYQEVSADRFGLLFCDGSLETALATIRQTTLQAIGKNMDSAPQVQPVYKFYDAEFDGYRPWKQSHPHISIRCRALIAWAPIAQRILKRTPVCKKELSCVNDYCEDLLSGMDHDEDKTKMERDRFAQAEKILKQEVMHSSTKLAPSSEQTDLAPQLLLSDSAEAVIYLKKVASPGKRIRLFDFLAAEALKVKQITTAQRRLEELAEQLDILPAYKKRVASMVARYTEILSQIK